MNDFIIMCFPQGQKVYANPEFIHHHCVRIHLHYSGLCPSDYIIQPNKMKNCIKNGR